MGLSLLRQKWFLYFLVIVNMAAGIYSLSYYAWQLNSSNVPFWPLIADCPFYAFVFASCALLLARGVRADWLFFLSIVGNIKFGLWTIFVLGVSGSLAQNWLAVASHLLLICETIVFFGLFEFRVRHVLLGMVWFALNDFVDYSLGMHPFVPNGFLQQAGLFAIAATLVLPLLLSVVFSKKSFQKALIGAAKRSGAKRWGKAFK